MDSTSDVNRVVTRVDGRRSPAQLGTRHCLKFDAQSREQQEFAMVESTFRWGLRADEHGKGEEATKAQWQAQAWLSRVASAHVRIP